MKLFNFFDVGVNISIFAFTGIREEICQVFVLVDSIFSCWRIITPQEFSVRVCSKAILNLLVKYFCLLLFSVFIYRCRYGGYTEAVKRILAQLPISAQSYSSSPYLDLTLFSYDDKWVSVMERPKTCDGYPIRSLFLHFLLKLTIVYSRQLVPRFCSIMAHSHEHEITTETSDDKAAQRQMRRQFIHAAT